MDYNKIKVKEIRPKGDGEGVATGIEVKPNLFELFINRRSQMFMIQLMVSNIIDEYCDYHFKDVRSIFKERVKEQLILAGAGHLADDSVLNYIGPRPKLADDPIFNKDNTSS